MPKTITEMVKEYQSEIANGNLSPVRGAEILTVLSALSGNINDEIIKRDYEYNLVLLEYLDSEQKANRAKIKAETTPEYISKKQAYNLKELNTEMIRGLKYLLKAYEDEYRHGKFQ